MLLTLGLTSSNPIALALFIRHNFFRMNYYQQIFYTERTITKFTKEWCNAELDFLRMIVSIESKNLQKQFIPFVSIFPISSSGHYTIL